MARTFSDAIDEDVMRKVAHLGALERRDIGRTALSVPAALSAGQQGGFGAALAAAQKYHPRAPQGPTQLDVVAQKQSLLNDMADYLKASRDDTADVLDKIGKMQGANDKMLGIFEQYVQGNQQASQAVAQARIRLVGDLTKEYADTARKRMQSRLHGSADLNRAYGEISELFFGKGPERADFGPQAVTELAAKVLYDPRLQAADQAEMWAWLRSEAAARNVNLNDILQKAATAGDETAGDMLAQLRGIQKEVAAVENDTLMRVNEKSKEAFASALRQGGGMSMPQLLRAWDQFTSIYDPNAGAESMERVLGTVFEVLRPDEGQPALMENYEKLLDELSKPDDQLSDEYAEMRNLLFQDPAFQAVKEQFGFKTDTETLKFLRQNMREQRRIDRSADAKRRRDLSSGAVLPKESDTSAAAAAAGGGLGEEAEMGSAGAPGATERGEEDARAQAAEATFAMDQESGELAMFDPSTGAWVTDQDHPAIKAETDRLNEMFEVAPEIFDEAVLGLMGTHSAARVGMQQPVPQVPATADKPQPTIAELSRFGEPEQGLGLAGQAVDVEAPPDVARTRMERPPLQLPSAGMLQQGMRSALFGVPAASRNLTGDINRALQRRAARKKQEDEEDEALRAR